MPSLLHPSSRSPLRNWSVPRSVEQSVELDTDLKYPFDLAQFGTLPPSLSYCPLPLPSHVPSTVDPIVRRDMFDAQFQLLASATVDDDDSAPKAESWGPDTDLVKGVYEGGMKTWECAGDLVGVLSSETIKGEGWKAVEGKKIMEVRSYLEPGFRARTLTSAFARQVGCGTAIPSVYLLQELLSKPQEEVSASPQPPQTTFYFLDYNEIVLQLVSRLLAHS